MWIAWFENKIEITNEENWATCSVNTWFDRVWIQPKLVENLFDQIL